ncbi:arylesterase [Paludibacterium yongneupense]|uniref:arylesterase n=1 Tax=Paludibacterium yongneupense TaxID=400061 RepID=UPI00040DE288|nr:arylesterase [Paludibacterium yongneupense]
MLRSLAGLSFLLLSALPVSAATVLVFGDSLSAAYGLAPGQGWVDLLARDLGPRHRVINASVSGETSAGGLTRLPQTLARVHPDIVVLELGGNDGLRGLPLPEMAVNLERMVELSRRAGARVVLIGQQLPPNYGQSYGDAFHAVFDALARRRRLIYVPLLVAGFERDLARFQSDGIHPRAEMQPRMMLTVKARLPL